MKIEISEPNGTAAVVVNDNAIQLNVLSGLLRKEGIEEEKPFNMKERSLKIREVLDKH